MRAAVFTETGGPLSIEDLEPTAAGPARRRRRARRERRLPLRPVAEERLRRRSCPAPCSATKAPARCVEVGAEVTRVKAGDRIIASFIPACGTCWFCLHDSSHLCDNEMAVMMSMRGNRPDGSQYMAMTGLGTFAEAMTCNESSIVKIDTELPDEQLALIGCGVTTGVGAALNTAEVQPGTTVAVIGCGGVGQAVIQGARIAGASRIIAVDPVEMKRKTAEQLGATDFVDPNEGDPVAQVQQLTGGRGVDYAFEVIGLPETTLQAYNMIRKGGTAVMVGMTRADAQVTIPTFDLFFNEKTLKGSKYGSGQVRRDFQRFVDLIETGRLDTVAHGVADDQARRRERRVHRDGERRSHPQRHHVVLIQMQASVRVAATLTDALRSGGSMWPGKHAQNGRTRSRTSWRARARRSRTAS